MKQLIDLNLEGLSEREWDFILTWKKRKYHEDLPILTLGHCIELLIATTYNLHKESSDSRFFNNIISNNESVIAWDGNELIDILFYEVRQAIKIRLS